MNEELKKELERLNSGIEMLGKAHAVKTAQGAPLPDDPGNEIESKGLTAKKLDEDFVDPLRKSFERLAKAAPSQFGHLGARTVLDDPYTIEVKKMKHRRISLSVLPGFGSERR